MGHRDDTPTFESNEILPADRAPADQGQAGPQAIRYSMSPGLPDFLGSHRIAIAGSSYQSGKFYLLGQNADGGLLVHERLFHKAMGLCIADRDTILLATMFQILKFKNVLAPGQRINDLHDACYVPRQIFTTGELDAHDVGVLSDGRIVFVNTLYNCLASTSERHSFTPIWKPSFISKIVKEDRCHLNGLAIEDGVPRYVTAISRSDTVDGWRDRRVDGGIVVDVHSNEIVIGGLSMPHSPRLYRGRLWVLNSGTGEIGWIERSAAGAKFHVLAFCPGFVRGLAFFGDYAFVGLSKPRYERFEGLALDRRLAETDSEPWCGIQLINLDTGTCENWFRIDGAVTEFYDLGVVPDVVRPMAIGFATNEILDFITHDPIDPAQRAYPTAEATAWDWVLAPRIKLRASRERALAEDGAQFCPSCQCVARFSSCVVGQITGRFSCVSALSRGAHRDRHECWVRDAMAAVSSGAFAQDD